MVQSRQTSGCQARPPENVNIQSRDSSQNSLICSQSPQHPTKIYISILILGSILTKKLYLLLINISSQLSITSYTFLLNVATCISFCFFNIYLFNINTCSLHYNTSLINNSFCLAMCFTSLFTLFTLNAVQS